MDAEHIRDIFSAFGPVTVRRMFGGAGIYADGLMFALVADGAIYLKAGPQNEPDFVREGLPPFTYTGKNGKRAVMSYRRMPDRLYDDPDALARWAHAALAVARDARKAPPSGRAARRATPRQAPRR